MLRCYIMLRHRTINPSLIGSAKRIGKAIVFRKMVPCFWSVDTNWGDALSPYLVERIAARKVRHEANPYCWKYLVVGSIIDRADAFSIIWGSGMISGDKLPKQRPHAIHAVRGPMTRQRLLKAGIKCPEVFGDPALLLPQFFNPPREAKWRIGIAPHYTDQNHQWVQAVSNEDGVRILNVRAGIEEFVRDLVCCECILSSSLHGLICADSYRIPNRRILLYEKLFGGDFKFLDYYGASSMPAEAPIRPRLADAAADLVSSVTRFTRGPDLAELMDSCPFRSRRTMSLVSRNCLTPE